MIERNACGSCQAPRINWAGSNNSDSLLAIQVGADQDAAVPEPSASATPKPSMMADRRFTWIAPNPFYVEAFQSLLIVRIVVGSRGCGNPKMAGGWRLATITVTAASR